uniref:Uncharacterized protein n=1 Tax=viral metagenome TaxID=1070528 RepID=A0A6C0HS57_9ZZZZ
MYLKIKKNKNIEFTSKPTIEKESSIAKSLKTQLEVYKTQNYHKLTKIIEPYGFLYSPIHSNDVTISHLIKDRLFFEFFEICTNIQFDEELTIFSTNSIFNDFLTYKKIPYTVSDVNYNFCFFDIDTPKREIIERVTNQSNNGKTIIKTKCSNQSIELVYFLSTVYNVILFRPKITTDSYMFIVCQKYQNNYQTIDYNINIYDKIPLYFVNNINDFYTIIQQRVLYFQSQLVFYLLHENNEKIKEIKNKNIANTITWCELYGIPYNNIKINIFSEEITLVV